MKQTQKSFLTPQGIHRYSCGGSLRRQRLGRRSRPLSNREPLHMVLKADSQILSQLRVGFRQRIPYIIIRDVILTYARRFYVDVKQVSIQGNHIHLLIRARRRDNYQAFFRVVAGQIAQRLLIHLKQEQPMLVIDTPSEPVRGQGLRQVCGRRRRLFRPVDGEKPPPGSVVRKGSLWLHQVFTRVVIGSRAFQIVRNYIQLNEQEAKGVIAYQKNRLRGLSMRDWELLWT